MIKIVVAVSKNNVIGKDNKLLWRQSEDLKRFKSLTLGQKVVMGRKTYESIGKPLPGRDNYVITKSIDKIEGCNILNSNACGIDTDFSPNLNLIFKISAIPAIFATGVFKS